MISLPPTKSPSPSLRTLEQRIANQERRISQGVANGTISKEEGARLRGELEKLQARIENDAFDGNGLSRGEEFAQQLNHSSEAIKNAAQDFKFDPAKRLNDIDQRIKQGEKDGSLSPEEAKNLKEESKMLRDALKNAKTPFERDVIKSLIDCVSKEVCAERHDGELVVDKRVDSFKQRIAAGVADGSLTPEEASKLTAQVGQLNPELLDSKTINQLSKAIFVARHNATVNVPSASTNLKSIILAGEKSGRLSPDQVSSLQAQLRDILRDGGPATGARLNALREEVRAMVQASKPAPPRYLPQVG